MSVDPLIAAAFDGKHRDQIKKNQMLSSSIDFQYDEEELRNSKKILRSICLC